MISQIDDALRALVHDHGVGSEVEIVFDAPTREWAARRNAPTVNLYLYDIREDLRRREVGVVRIVDDDGRVTGRRRHPRYYKFSYLVTAWTQRPEDEHRVLSALLSCFVRADAIPRELTVGPLAEAGQPLPITVALPPPEDRAFADVWSALGGELKPSLDVVVIAPVFVGAIEPAGPPVTLPPMVAVDDTDVPSRSERRTRHIPPPARAGEPDAGESARRGAGMQRRHQRPRKAPPDATGSG